MRERYKVHRGKSDNVIDVKYTYAIYLDLRSIGEEYENDELTLESHDSNYKQKLTLGNDGERIGDAWVKVVFTKLIPKKDYRCVLVRKKSDFGKEIELPIFECLPLDVQHFNRTEMYDEPFIENEDFNAEYFPDWVKATNREMIIDINENEIQNQLEDEDEYESEDDLDEENTNFEDFLI